MAELLVFSDSHGRVEGMLRAYEAQIRRPDLIVHLGDGAREFGSMLPSGVPTLSVRGNCDLFGAENLPEEILTEEAGHRILLLHGHRFGVKGGLGALISHAVDRDADIVLFGHTHCPTEYCIPKGEVIRGMRLERPLYLFNPGSIGKNEDGLGLCFGTASLRRDQVLLSHGRI